LISTVSCNTSSVSDKFEKITHDCIYQMIMQWWSYETPPYLGIPVRLALSLLISMPMKREGHLLNGICVTRFTPLHFRKESERSSAFISLDEFIIMCTFVRVVTVIIIIHVLYLYIYSIYSSQVNTQVNVEMFAWKKEEEVYSISSVTFSFRENCCSCCCVSLCCWTLAFNHFVDTLPSLHVMSSHVSSLFVKNIRSRHVFYSKSDTGTSFFSWMFTFIINQDIISVLFFILKTRQERLLYCGRTCYEHIMS